jgi:hypothetical protein
VDAEREQRDLSAFTAISRRAKWKLGLDRTEYNKHETLSIKVFKSSRFK